MIDYKDDTQRRRLLTAVRKSREALNPFRANRLDLLRDYVGNYYSGSGAKVETLVNLINQTADIYTVALVSQNPRVSVTAKHPKMRPFARKFKIAVNTLIEDLHLSDTLQAIVLDAVFSMGIAKICLVDAGQLEIQQDVWYDPGRLWVERISIDDAVLDMNAKSLSKMRFAGDRYRVSFDKVKEEPAFDRKIVDQLSATSKFPRDGGGEYARDIASGGVVDDDELEPMIWLQDLWLPENQEVATFACDVDLEPLLVREWTGSQGGPYKYLGFADVPDNNMPSAPAQNLKGLADLYNGLYRKIARRARGQKDNPVYQPGAEDDAERIRRAGDGEWIKVRDASAVSVVHTGGVDQPLMALQMAVLDIFDRMGGNVRAMAGLGQQGDTLGQEQIIQQNTNKTESKMLMRVLKFTSEVCSDLGSLMWDSETLEIEGHEEVGRTGVFVPQKWEPGNRDGKRAQYDFQVEPYSMMYQPPEAKVGKIFQTLQALQPMWPLFQSAGANLNAKRLMEIISEYRDLPELAEIVDFAPQDQEGQGPAHDATQSPVTTRTNVRRNVPTGGTPDSRSMVMQQALLGGGSTNPQQQASITRPGA